MNKLYFSKIWFTSTRIHHMFMQVVDTWTHFQCFTQILSNGFSSTSLPEIRLPYQCVSQLGALTNHHVWHCYVNKPLSWRAVCQGLYCNGPCFWQGVSFSWFLHCPALATRARLKMRLASQHLVWCHTASFFITHWIHKFRDCTKLSLLSVLYYQKL